MQDTGKSKVTQFHVSHSIQEDICWFDVSVKYSNVWNIPVTFVESTAHLIKHTPYKLFIQKTVASINWSLQSLKIMHLESLVYRKYNLQMSNVLVEWN